MQPDSPAPSRLSRFPRNGGWLVWALAFLVMGLLDQRIGLASQATLLVLAAALSGLVWPAWLCALVCALAVLLFNVFFVPPRGTLHVELAEHVVVLLSMLVVGTIVAVLVARQRELARREQQLARLSEQLRRFADGLRECDQPAALGQRLRQALREATGIDARLLLVQADGVLLQGELDADQRSGLELCVRHAQALGPGSGRHEEQPAWYLPLRGRASCPGAALLPLPRGRAPGDELRDHAQALCDQVGLTLERAEALQQASEARELAQLQALRNTLLAAIAHDHRTPMATLLGAASALHDQADRLTPAQVQRLAASMVEEVGQLSRLSENMLQLARLESPRPTLSRDWESLEELVGSVLRRRRQRGEADRLQLDLAPALPLLHCDALLLVQLLDNLIDNALRHAGGSAPIEIHAHCEGDELILAVRDRGPGVPADQRERIFETFQRGDRSPEVAAQRGVGVGLAVCRAIARAHGGEIRYLPRPGGGASFELALPIAAPPAQPKEALEDPLP